MTKEKIFSELRHMLAEGEITKVEIAQSLMLEEEGHYGVIHQETKHHFSFVNLFYIIGAGVIVLGLIIFVTQVWEDLSPAMHIIITLGIGTTLVLLGSLLWSREEDDRLGTISQIVGGVLVTLGGGVVLRELNINNTLIASFLFMVIASFYQGLNLIYRKPILTFFTVSLSTIATYLLVGYFVEGSTNSYYYDEEVYFHLTMAVGVAYVALGHWFENTWNQGLQRILYLCGSIAILAAGFIRMLESDIWHILYLLALVGTFYLSIRLKTRIMLALTTLFMIFYCAYITGEYFADSLGWPIALIVLGLVFVGIASLSIRINKKYITN